MNRKENLAQLMAAVAASALLASCGGGGGSDTAGAAPGPAPAPAPGPAPAPSPNYSSVAGLYFGTASGGRSFDALLLDDGRMYGMLGAGGGITTVFYGDGTVTNAGYTSGAGGNLTTSSGNPLGPGSVALTGVPGTSISGTLTGSGSGFPATFNATYRTAIEGTPTLASVAGTYSGDSSGLGRVIGAILEVSTQGELSGVSSDNCQHTGTLTPNPSANLFDLRLTFGANCPQQGLFTGHAMLSAANGASPAKLSLFGAAGISANAITHGWIFIGGKL